MDLLCKALCLLLSFAFLPARAAELSLDRYLSEVSAANPALRSALVRGEASVHRVRPAATWEDPFFAIGIDEKPFSGEDMTSVRRYQLSQSVPFPGKLAAKRKGAESRALSAQGDAETLRRELVVLATQAFYRAYYNQQTLAANERIRSLVRNTMDSAKARYKTGEAGHHDWLLAQVELSVLEVERLRLIREQKTLQAVANELRNEPGDRELGALRPDFSDSSAPDTDENEIMGKQPELVSYEALVHAAEHDRRLAKLSYFPDLVLQAMIMEPVGMAPAADEMSPEPEMRSSWGVMVGLSLPLFFFRKQNELVAAAEREKEAALLDKRSLENRVRSELVDAREQLKAARDAVSLYKESVMPATQLAFSNAKSGYAARRLPLSQLLETARVQRTQELELIAAQIDVELAKTRLREVLSSPPVLRLAPSRPTVFGGGGMGGMGGSMSQRMSETVNMGSGMSGPTRKTGGSQGGIEMGGSGGMEGM